MNDEDPKPLYHLPVYGDVEIKDAVHGIILLSPNKTKYRVTVDNTGTLVVTAL